jgi:hypothetical protein
MFTDDAELFQNAIDTNDTWEGLSLFRQEQRSALSLDDSPFNPVFSFDFFDDLGNLEQQIDISEKKKPAAVNPALIDAVNQKKTISFPLISKPLLQHPSEATLIPHKSFAPFYGSTTFSSLKIPEGKKRHISAPFDDEFIKLCSDSTLIIEAHANGFIPNKFWDKNAKQTFGWCLLNFFQKKNNTNTRFLYKLYNALLIDTLYPQLSPYIGVSWLNKRVIKVNKHLFGRFIGIKTVDNSLFHQQGNFPSHKFVEISSCEAKSMCPDVNLDGVDFDNIRILYHSQGVFVKGCTEAQITNCKSRK